MIGRTLKHYKIEALLGAGGMGVVYRARDTRLERPVALKVLKPELVADPERRNRFLREARVAAALSHPSIAQVYDIDEDGGTTFIAMEFIDGRTISRLIAEGELDLQGSVEIALQISEGLAKAHEAGIIHRDIKSDNIMLTRDGHAKLLDFGLAKLLDAPPEPEPGGEGGRGQTMTMEQAHTIAGAVIGTISYMSPEQARGRDLDPRSDVFSLGVVLYEMVTGELPFKGASPLDTMHSIAYEEATPVTLVRKTLPPRLHMIVSRCLRKRREDRYEDARALVADLKHLKHDLETGSNLALRPAERLRDWFDKAKAAVPLGRSGLILLMIAVVAAAGFALTRIPLGSLISFGIVGLIVYRALRNRKARMMKAAAKKISASPEVMAVIVRGDRMTVILDKAPAKTYIRVTSLMHSVNEKMFFGKPISGEIRDNVAEAEFGAILRQPGVVYARADILKKRVGG